MANYRRTEGWGYQRWHFCKNCRNWPEHNYEATSTKPSPADICPTCESLAASRNCSSPYGF